MTKLAETYFRLGIRLEEQDRLAFQSYLERQARDYAEELFGQHPEIAVYVADGSLRSWLVVAGALYVGIGQYGSFRSGVDHIIRDARKFSERVFEDVQKSGISKSEILRFERRLGVPGKIQRVFRRIDRLEKHGQDLSKAEYDRELRSINTALLDIFRKLDLPQDRDLGLKNIPKEFRSNLPDRLPTPVSFLPT